MILAPQEINPSISEEEIRQVLRQLADQVNVVVLVPSRRRAEDWQGAADLTAAADAIANAVERLQSGHVGLVAASCVGPSRGQGGAPVAQAKTNDLEAGEDRRNRLVWTEMWSLDRVREELHPVEPMRDRKRFEANR